MTKFINSRVGVISPLQLWQEVPTQVSIQETYELKIYPITNIFNDGPINFNLPKQPNGMLRNVDIVVKLRIDEDGKRITNVKKDLSVINNFASSLWELVDVRVDDRTDLMQSMRNSYPYHCFFSNILNTETNRGDFLFENEIFKMDEGDDKADAEDTHALLEDLASAANDLNKEIIKAEGKDISWENILSLAIEGGPKGATVKVPQYNHYNYAMQLRTLLSKEEGKYISVNPKNPASGHRAMRINKGQSVTLNSKLQCPLLMTHKCLPTNIKIRVSLTKNSDNFLLMAPEDSKYQVVIEDIFLNVSYFRPIDVVLRQVDDHIKREPAPYFISKPELILRPITNSNRMIRVNDLFHNKLPSYAFFCLQKTSDYEGKRDSSPFIFEPFAKFQMHVDGVPYFVDPLDISYEEINGKKLYTENGMYLRQLYKTIGREYKGDSLVTSKNFQLNFVVGVSFTADKSNTSAGYLNLQQQGSTNLEIDMGYDHGIPNDMLLIIYAIYDRQVKIDEMREFTIIDV